MSAPLSNVVIDNGTSFTKLGFSGNVRPNIIIPTTISYDKADNSYIGSNQNINPISDPIQLIRRGQIVDFESMSDFWSDSYQKQLQCRPEEYFTLLTEPPLNTPENREKTGEIMFETFGVPGLHIAVQAVLALASSWTSNKTAKVEKPLTGVVVDIGDGVSHVIPVIDGYTVGSAIKQVPLAGYDVTLNIQQLLRERNIGINPNESFSVAKMIKEEHSYICPNVIQEEKNAQPINFVFKSKNGTEQTILLGKERFLGPEILFNPKLAKSSKSKECEPLPNIIDSVIQSCPIDCRRALYGNIVLSGGTTMFKDLNKRIQRDLRLLVDERLKEGGGTLIKVNVIAHENQKYAVWNGGSLLASMDQFPSFCHSKKEYEEYGASICRKSRVFTSLLV